MRVDQIENPVGSLDARRKGRVGKQSQKSGHADPERYENLLRRMDEVCTELVNLRREHRQFISSLRKRLLPLSETRSRKTDLTPREQQIHEMRLAGRLEKEIASFLGLGVSTVKSVEYRVRKKAQMQREREEATQKKKL